MDHYSRLFSVLTLWSGFPRSFQNLKHSIQSASKSAERKSDLTLVVLFLKGSKYQIWKISKEFVNLDFYIRKRF